MRGYVKVPMIQCQWNIFLEGFIYSLTIPTSLVTPAPYRILELATCEQHTPKHRKTDLKTDTLKLCNVMFFLAWLVGAFDYSMLTLTVGDSPKVKSYLDRKRGMTTLGIAAKNTSN